MAKVALLQLEWDSYECPSEFSVFGLDAITQVDGLPTLEWKAKASDAWQWLESNGFKPVAFGYNGKRVPVAGYVRPAYVRFVQEAA